MGHLNVQTIRACISNITLSVGVYCQRQEASYVLRDSMCYMEKSYNTLNLQNRQPL